MLLWLLLMHLAIHLLTATNHTPETKNSAVRPIDKAYVIKHIDSCPDVGYYFKREAALNELAPGVCYLCFCRGQDSAVCWKRENKRCDVESFHYHGLGKRDTRVRRSPGIADIFFRDAARDVFNKATPEQCKPFESSFSDGCPPADWCIGCTVCDCDANGRWDCHILSFCPDKKGGKKMRKKKQRVNIPKKTESPVKPTPTTTFSSTKRNTGKHVDKPKTQTKRIARMDRTSPRPRIVKKSAPKDTTKPAKRKPPLRYRKVAQRNATVRPKIINKNVATHKPIDLVKRSKMQKVLNSNNDTVKLAQQVVKRVMAVVQKMVRNEMKNLTKLMNQSPKPSFKKINKRNVQKGTIRKPLKKYFVRNKRHLMLSDIDVDSTTQITDNLSINIGNDTMIPVSQKPLVTDKVDKATFATTSNHNESEYYKYSLGVEQVTTMNPIVMNDVYQTETVLNLMTTERSKPPSYDQSNGNEITSILDTFPEANDLKFKKWSYVKILKEKHSKSEFHNTNPIEITNPKNKVHTKDIERKLFPKKYNVVKMVNSYKMTQDQVNHNQTTAQSIQSKISDLQYSVAKLFSQFHKNNTEVNKNKRRKVGFMKYIRRFFYKIFKHKNKRINRLTEFKVIESLCDNFGPCKVNIKEKILLKSKLKELNDEAVKILRIIQIIKGLLQLVDIPTNSEASMSKTPSCSNDIQKLNSILKGTYIKNENLLLSATQTTQIDYIKKNTEHFVQAVSKFAILLNEIVAILIKNDTRGTENFHRILRDTEKQNIEEDPFKNFKHLLVRYNLIQNDFIKKMYKMLIDFEKKINLKKVSETEHTDLNNTIVIEAFSKNIITNLRKLKEIAQLLNSSGRMKRDTLLKEDSIEYVLTVMQYLMKQYHPLDAGPVNDGIDLLIDAIRNAPDIKPIKKKVLENKPSFPITPFDTESIGNNDHNSEDNRSFLDKPLNENPKISPNDSKDSQLVDEGKQIQLFEAGKDNRLVEEGKENQSVEEGKENDNSSFLDKKEYDVTESVYYKDAEKTITDMDNHIGMSPQVQLTQEDNKDLIDDINDSKSELDIDTDKKEHVLSDNDKKEADVAYNDDRKLYDTNNDLSLQKAYHLNADNEVVPRAITSATEVAETNEPTSEPEIASVNKKSYILDDSVDSKEKKIKFDAKSQLDWIEENFGMDPKRLSNITEVTPAAALPKTTNVNLFSVKPVKDNDSLIAIDPDVGNEKKKINIEEVMLRKQMDLLNSLDYGTERSDFENSDSKDSNEERYSSDSFPSYFI